MTTLVEEFPGRIHSIAVGKATLEDVFIHLTGHRLEENVGADQVELTPDDLQRIEAAVAKIQIQGARYTAQQEEAINR